MDCVINLWYVLLQCVCQRVLTVGFRGAEKHRFVMAHCHYCRYLKYLSIFVTIVNGTVAFLPTFR